ncbi:MAG TPA: FtsW/RodA/SpoVE family cell cycle protein [Candidatus Sulfopaludibacter sp.]|jgi:cell division protein FtsI/penicillin-binding protein 2/cell division protein FtsW (lipid II flippase)|nr:FtsW/RodA/SpoVE family cell cycle protein [Candidatus Sulfopaludibacter sp.]
MAVTRSWSTSPLVMTAPKPARRRGGILLLLCATLLVGAALALVYTAKVHRFSGGTQLVNLNTVSSPEELAPLFELFPDRAQREELSRQTFEFLEHARPLRNVGALSALRAPGTRHPLLPLAKLKPLMAVRTPKEFQREFLLWTGLYFAGFYLVALAWRAGGFTGDRAFLPALHLLTGLGLALMASMRDPLRDTLEFHKFALGVFLGCLLLILPALRFFDYRRLSDWCYTPLFAALALFGALMLFGKGPAGNDAKVNLGPFQPVELVKILLVIFLAGYFTRNWERLRDLRNRLGTSRLQHVAPVLVAVGVSLVFFFELKDLGPALVTFFVFLSMFAVARGRPGLALAGLALMVGSVAVGYRMGQPHTVVDRIDMWLSPWDNNVHGGDQLAHGLWALSTGGPFGSGPGWGDPEMIPAGSTDLVLPAIGEEWGFAGVAAVFLLFGFLIARALRAAARCRTHFGFFLALGLGCLIAYEMMLISAGVLGVLPLSGVVSPFLSSGNTAMLANFLIFAILLSISADGELGEAPYQLLERPARIVKLVLAAVMVVLVAAAARYQVVRDTDYLARDAHSFEQDGVKRPQHNPRMNSLAREIPRGTIYDRNAIPLATSSWAELMRHQADYQSLGISVDKVASQFDTRHYPFGAALALVVGDLRTGENFHATNSSLVEHDAAATLQGYRYEELASLIRYRHRPGNAGIARLLARDRNVYLTLDVRLQLRAKSILEEQLRKTGNRNGAVVVMDAGTGDVLAMVSTPAPQPPGMRPAAPSNDELLDRARYGQYPPGSTFKLVTAIAALRLNPDLKRRTFQCRTLPDGRAGNVIAGWNRPIKDDIGDHAHGTLDMGRAIAVSCNAYFAQLGVHDVGSQALAETAAQLGISTGEAAELRKALPFASYGQGPVLISPFKMARVAAAIAGGGRMPEGRWIAGQGNTRDDAPLEILPPSQAAFIAGAMRRVVTEGTARHAMAGETLGMAGKTGTAQLDEGMPHAWFAGFAPYDADASHRLAFAVLVEHGGYGGAVSAPIARSVMEAAKELGILGQALSPAGKH